MDPYDREHFVYLLKQGSKIKIGRTWNVGLRTRVLGYGKKRKPQLSGYIVCRDLWASQNIETAILRWAHGGKIPRRKNREWFELDPAIVNHFFKQTGAVICR